MTFMLKDLALKSLYLFSQVLIQLLKDNRRGIFE